MPATKKTASSAESAFSFDNLPVAKRGEFQISANVGKHLREVMDRAKRRSGGDSLEEPLKDADIVRDALRHWARESPYAMDAGEMALLLASRRFRAHNELGWAGAMRSFGGAAADAAADPELEARINEYIESISERGARADDSRDKREVQSPRKRKAS